jgi:hypothetical protein
MMRTLSSARCAWRSLLGAIGLGIVLAGCGGNAQPSIVTFVPTETPTVQPSPTAAPVSSAPTAPAASATPEPTRSPTTPTPGPSPTSLLAPTTTPAPFTLTATRAPTLAGLSVEYFTTDSEYVIPGDNVTLFWSVRGADRARIFRVDADGERLFRWDVAAAGRITVATRRADRDVARFLLTAEVSGATIEQDLLIPLRCPEVWFFDPPPDACPADSGQFSAQAEQTFEQGRMIWVQALDRIYVVFEDGVSPAWAQYPDEFEEGVPERDDSLAPPPGLEQPVRGFGLVWRSNPRVQERLGWATSPEIPYEGMYQADSVEPSVATTYLRLRDGGIVALDAFEDDWEVLPPLENETPE